MTKKVTFAGNSKVDPLEEEARKAGYGSAYDREAVAELQQAEDQLPMPVHRNVPVVRIASNNVLISGYGVRASVEQKIMMINCIAGDSDEITEVIGKEITLESAIVIEHQWPRDDGGLEDGYKVWLICADGKVYFSGSTGIAKTLLAINSAFGPPPWLPKFVCRIEEKRSGGKNRWYCLNVLRQEKQEKVK